MEKIFILIVLSLFVMGCTTKADIEMAKLHYQAQQKEQTPIFLLEAKDGENIVLSGVKTFAVYDKSSNNIVTSYRKDHHPAWSILGTAVQIALPIYAQGYSMYRLADVVGKHAGGNGNTSWNNSGDYREGSPDNNSTNWSAGGDYREGSPDNNSTNWANSGDYREGSPDNNSTNYDISGRAYSDDNIDSTHVPIVVTQPDPVIVNPVIVNQPDPIIVNPVIVNQPDPIIINNQ